MVFNNPSILTCKFLFRKDDQKHFKIKMEELLNKDSCQTQEFAESSGVSQQAISLSLKAMWMVQMRKRGCGSN